MKKALKILSVALTVVLLIGIFSCATPVFAAEVTEKDCLDSTVEQFKTQVEDLENKTLYEVEEGRDEFTKVFKNIDGTKTAIVSATPIHYETANGWEDIDNTLIEEAKVTGKIYKNKKNDFTVIIPQEIASGKELKIEKNDYSIAFELEGSDIFSKNKKIKGNKKNKNQKSTVEQNGLNTDFLDKTAEVIFENIGEKTSVEYEVTSTGLKENIILNEKPESDVTYKYKITAKKLIAQLNDDKAITFKNVNGESVFEIPAPIMYDADNNISKNIDVELIGKNGKYTLIYKPSFEWLRGALTYPVVIDPVINTVNGDLGVRDTVADSANPNDNFNDSVILSTYKSDTGNQQSFIDISNNYILKNGAKIKTVLLGLYYEGGLFVDNSTTVAAYTVTSDWSESTLTYNNRPTTVNSLIERRAISRDTTEGYLYLDVTKAYTLKEETYGVCIRQRDNVTNEAMLMFSSSETSNASHQPFFIIEFYETQGVEEQFDYHAFDVGRVGTAYFNDFTEQVYIERDELGLSGINMPVQIKRYFNSDFGGTYSAKYLTNFNVVSTYGSGWRTNYDQCIEYYSNIDGNPTILYCNGNGQVTYFEKGQADSATGQTVWNEKTDKFSDSEGYSLYIPTQYANNISDNLQHVTIKDSSGQVYEFNSSGFLTKINSAEEGSTNSIRIIYNTDDYKIQKVIDGVGREFRFSYTEYEEWPFPLLTSIQAFAPNGSAITVNNDSGEKVPYKMTYNYAFSNYMYATRLPMLSTATYPDGETVYYSVSDNLISLKNIDGCAIEFAFNESNTIISEKVYSEEGTSFTNGGQLTITDENAYEKSYVDLNETKITKQFDMYGRTINTKNNGDITQSVACTYSDDYKAQGSVSYSFYNTYEQNFTGEETNLVTNGSFATSLSGWEISNNSKVKQTASYDCKTDSETPGSLQISGVRDTAHYAAQKIDIENGKSGDEYRLDYFVKNTTHSHMVVDLLQLDTIIVEARNNVEGNENWTNVATVEANPFNNNWQKYSFSFDVDFEYNEIRLIMCYWDQYGAVCFDDVSLVNTYKVPANQVTDTETDNENSDSSDGNSNTPGCDCDGCNTLNCPCTTCSDNCSLPYCNRGYEFENDSQGTSFSITDGEKIMTMEQNVIGNYYGSQTDLNGIYTSYNYDQMNGQLTSMSDGYNMVTSYSYDAMSRLNKVENIVDGLSNGNSMETSYSYDDDRLESITHNDFSYNYEYDVWGNPTAVKVGEQALVSYTYDSANETRDRVNRITYGNGDYTDYTYTADGNISDIKSYSADGTLTAEYDYIYGDNGNLQKVKNNIENSEIRYSNDGFENVLLNADGTDKLLLYSKNMANNAETVENFNLINYTKSEKVVVSDSVTGEKVVSNSIVSPSKTYSFNIVTDYFGRTKSKDTILRTEVGNGYTGSEKVRESYEYAGSKDPDKPDVTTSLVSKYTITHGTYVETVDKEVLPEISVGFYEIYSKIEYLYDYDSNGNITRIRLKVFDENGNSTITELNSYIYDSVGQLIRENNYEMDQSVVYVYDKGGNIAQKKEYAYSTGELGEVISTINYTYDNEWKDKLTAYGDNLIETDAMGNPLNYYADTFLGESGVEGALEWNGRQLSAIVVDGKRYEYSYNADGMRSSVKIYSENNELENVYYYIWRNGKLIGYYFMDSEETSAVLIKLIYDGADEPIGFEAVDSSTGETYYFHYKKNLQGDITAVCEDDGTEIFNYYYDSWGKITAIEMDTNAFAVLIALICTPITYRGYNYDVFTGLYYLQSRYYNPTYGRFLNADTTEILEATQGTPHGANLFAYCNNNPVNCVDFGGCFSTQIIKKIIILIIGIYLSGLLLSWLDIIPDFMLKWKITKLLKDSPELEELVEYWAEKDKTTGYVYKYWYIYSIFMAHTKNLVDYARNPNLNYSYPNFNEIVGEGVSYQKTLELAYERLTYCNYYDIGTSWEDLGPNGQFELIHYMYVYDPSTYRQLYNFSLHTLLEWGGEKLDGFFKGLLKIAKRRV